MAVRNIRWVSSMLNTSEEVIRAFPQDMLARRCYADYVRKRRLQGKKYSEVYKLHSDDIDQRRDLARTIIERRWIFFKKRIQLPAPWQRVITIDIEE